MHGGVVINSVERTVGDPASIHASQLDYKRRLCPPKVIRFVSTASIGLEFLDYTVAIAVYY